MKAWCPECKDQVELTDNSQCPICGMSLMTQEEIEAQWGPIELNPEDSDVEFVNDDAVRAPDFSDLDFSEPEAAPIAEEADVDAEETQDEGDEEGFEENEVEPETSEQEIDPEIKLYNAVKDLAAKFDCINADLLIQELEISRARARHYISLLLAEGIIEQSDNRGNYRKIELDEDGTKAVEEIGDKEVEKAVCFCGGEVDENGVCMECGFSEDAFSDQDLDLEGEEFGEDSEEEEGQSG